ncbi:MAG: ABC transporter ATP-binding protein/permease [Mediterranea sp.]|jgi:ABC-type multidrug transport system fused ATPase/permease subunit|nr:ABC transporter ATP-binding protein/permease [Mediterranea sp.]
MKKQLGWIWEMMKGQRWRIALRICLDLLSLALGLFFVYESKHAVDIATGASTGSLHTSVFLLVASVAVSILTGQYASWLSNRVKIRLTITLQDTLTEAQMRTVWRKTKRWHTGDVLTRLNTDVEEVAQMMAITFPSICVTGVRILASWLFLWTMDATLAWMILGTSPLFLFSKLYYRRMRRLNRETKQMESRLGIVLQENLRQRLLIRALCMGHTRKQAYQTVQEGIKQSRYSLQNFSVFTQLVLRYTFNGGYLLAFVWGIYRMHSGLITFGTMTAFLQLVARVQAPVLTLISFVPAAIRCRTSLERLADMNDEEHEKEGNTLYISHPQSVELQDVSFGYEDRTVIVHLNAMMRPGEPTAIVGATGRGKTTLFRLLLGLLRPDEGKLFMQTDQGEIPLSVATRINFAYVPQGNTLFSGTIRENLLAAVPTADEIEMTAALKLSCAEFVELLPQGLDTQVGEGGYGLSEGQAQRIAIARALLCPGNIWLFDEATSALDKDTASQLVHNLMRQGKENILIFITHDVRLMEACSQVIRLDK